MPSNATLYRVGTYTVDLRQRVVSANTGRLRLAWRHFEALKVLLEADGQVVPKEHFLQRLWPGATIVDDSNLTQCISQLRKALDNGNPGVQYLETVPRVGYRLVALVEEVARPAVIEAPATVEAPHATKSGLHRWSVVGGAAVLLVAGSALALAWQWQRQPAQQSALAVERASDLLRRGDARAAAAELQHAIELDPRNARAYSALAHALHQQSFHDSLPTPADQSPPLEAAARAVALDPQCGECHGTLGFFLFYHHWRWGPAEAHLREGMRLAPERESIRPSLAMLLAATGRPAEALGQIDIALTTRPYEVMWHGIRAAILYLQRRYPEAVAAADKALAINETHRPGWEWRSRALFQMNRGAEAVNALAQEAFAARSTELDLAVRQEGTDGGLRKLLEITGDWRGRVEQSWRRAPWRALLKDDEGALEELERAYEHRNVNLIYIGLDPVFDRIRAHPRFLKVLADMGLQAELSRHSAVAGHR
jgi:DNA-binding winged helix-turn-helix (wHTH) protein